MSLSRRSLAAAFAAACAAAAAPAWAQPSPGTSSQDRQQRLTSAESFVPMPTFSTGVLQRNAWRGTLVVDMGLDVPDTGLRRRTRSNEPRLRDALRTALSTYASTFYRARTAPDPAHIARLMQQAVDRTLGGGGAQVLIVNVLFQAGGRR